MGRPILIYAAGLCLLAGLGGLWLGIASLPPSETEIIERYARVWVEEEGGARTDCYARPSPLAQVRLVVVCDGAGADGPEARAFPVDRQGRLLDIDTGDLWEGPST